MAERRHERQEEECKKLKEEWAAERSNTQDCQGDSFFATRCNQDFSLFPQVW